jgi:hypothetical protein
MLHPIFSTVVARPDLVLDHMSGYVALAAEEVATTGNDFKRRAIGLAVAGVFVLLFLVFAGVATMLGFAIGQFHWALAAVPGVALLVALAAYFGTRPPPVSERFAELRNQARADMALMRAAGDRHGH